MIVEISLCRCSTVMSASGSLFQITMSGEPAGGNHADLTCEAHEPGIAARVGNDRLHRRHADLLDQQLRLLAMPTPMAEGRGVAGVAAAHHRYDTIARTAKHLKGGVQ